MTDDESQGPAAAAALAAPAAGIALSEEAMQLQPPGLLELGVIGTEGAAVIRAAAAAAAAAKSAADSHLSSKNRATTTSSSSSVKVSKKAGQAPPGAALAAARLAFFARRKEAKAQGHMKLQQLLRIPQADLVAQYPKLDPDLAKAWARGIADAEHEVLQMLYPDLGPLAMPQATLEGLSPKYK
jgi:hypothetical protein